MNFGWRIQSKHATLDNVTFTRSQTRITNTSVSQSGCWMSLSHNTHKIHEIYSPAPNLNMIMAWNKAFPYGLPWGQLKITFILHTKRKWWCIPLNLWPKSIKNTFRGCFIAHIKWNCRFVRTDSGLISNSWPTRAHTPCRRRIWSICFLSSHDCWNPNPKFGFSAAICWLFAQLSHGRPDTSLISTSAAQCLGGQTNIVVTRALWLHSINIYTVITNECSNLPFYISLRIENSFQPGATTPTAKSNKWPLENFFKRRF